jgi:hypothetical protein
VEDGASHFINVVQASEEEDASEDGLAWEDALSVRDLRAIVAIVLVLIALTVAFETAKEYLEESVSEDQEIILEKFFGELTVLGFLSMLTFFITKTGVIGHISEQVFGNEEELLEYFEYVYAVVPVYLSFYAALHSALLWSSCRHPTHTRCRLLPRLTIPQIRTLCLIFHHGLFRHSSPDHDS